MIKKILFISAFIATGFLSAQSLQLMDHYDNSIDGLNHEEIGSAVYLSSTKFHVKNLTTNSFNYAAKVYLISNSTGVDLQVCFGTACYTANGSTSGSQSIPGSATLSANQIDSTFKVAPFTFSWNTGDSAVWKVTIYNVSNTSDSTSTIIKWKNDGSTTVIEYDEVEAKFNAYPNPALNNLTINYSISETATSPKIEVYDVVGKKLATHKLLNTKGRLNLDVSDLNSGVYFYTIYANNKALKTERIIIK